MSRLDLLVLGGVLYNISDYTSGYRACSRAELEPCLQHAFSAAGQQDLLSPIDPQLKIFDGHGFHYIADSMMRNNPSYCQLVTKIIQIKKQLSFSIYEL